jgi:hypothetical protein
MQRLLTWIITLGMAAGSLTAGAAGDTKAAEVLAKARAAIGGDKQIAKVQGLAIAGTVSRAIGDRTVTGDLTIDVQLPDKMLRTDSISPMGDSAVVVQEQGFNGDTLLRFSKVLNAPPGMVMRTPPAPAAGTDAEAQQLRNSRAEFARFVVALLLTSPKAAPVDFAYGGEAESPDGKADVLDLKGEGSFTARLLVDKESHRPLMITYRGVSPQIRVQTQTMQGPPPAGGARPGGREGDAHGEPAAPPAPDLVEINMFFDDYRSVDGLMLPHHVSRAVDGKTTEEWTFKTVKVNPAFKPDTFARK